MYISFDNDGQNEQTYSFGYIQVIYDGTPDEAAELGFLEYSCTLVLSGNTAVHSDVSKVYSFSTQPTFDFQVTRSDMMTGLMQPGGAP